MDTGTMESRRAQREGAGRAHVALSMSLGLVCCGLVVGTSALTVLNGLTLRQALVDEGIVSFCLLTTAFAVVGSILAARRPRNPVGWILLAAASLQILVVASEQYATYTLLTNPGALPLGDMASWLKEWVWAPGLGLIVIGLPLVFPTGRPPTRRWWTVAWVGVLAVGIISIMGAVAVWPHRGPALMASGGEAEYTLAPAWAFVTDWIAFPLMVLAALLAMASLVVRFRRADEQERKQVLWVAVAVGLSLMFGIAAQTLDEGATGVAVAALGLAVTPSIPIAVGVTVMRHRLYDLDLVLDRTFVWGGLAAIVVAFYVLVVGGVGALLRAEGSLLLSLAATGAVAVLFAPLRQRLQRAVNRLVYGERDDPYAVLSRLGQRIEAALAPQEVLPAVTESVASALKLPYVAIEVPRGDQSELAAKAGRPGGEVLRLPLVYGSETVGALLISPRTPGKRFADADLRLLADLARQIGAAVHALRLTEDLQRSRERLVVAREEERRRLRRDLHDGLGPALSSAIMKVAAARRRLPPESDVDTLLADIRDDLRGSVRDIRSLAHDLRPPALDQLGLVAALEDDAMTGVETEANGRAVAVAVVAPKPLPSMPAAVEVAAYLIAREALSNATRHSQGRSALVRITVDDGELQIQISDDGTGLPTGYRAGVGLTSMRERAEELGGTLEVDASSAGTTVLARLPAGRRSS